MLCSDPNIIIHLQFKDRTNKAATTFNNWLADDGLGSAFLIRKKIQID
jgi:hypothetical protein